MQISSELIKIFEYLGEKLGLTIDWTSQNVLPYIKQLCEKFIMWEINTSYAWIWIAGVAIVIGLIVTILLQVFSDLDCGHWVVFCIVTVISLAIIGCQVFDIIECRYFPEKAIYDYIQSYMTTH